MSLWKLQRPLTLALILAGLSGSLFAVDGTILIDQNRAFAGNVTIGDLPGFPISITQPGSYRLSGNITVAAMGVNAIEISASDVTLDLNGFQIFGPAVFCADPTSISCGPTYGVTTVPLSSQYKGIRILGGTVTGFASQLGLFNANFGLVEDLVLLTQPGGNLTAQNSVGLKYVVKHLVSDGFFSVGCPGTVVVESVASGYLRQGSNLGCVFTDNIGSIF